MARLNHDTDKNERERDMTNPSSRLNRLFLFVLTFFLLWILWVLFLIHFPHPLNHWVIRAAVRILIWVGLAVAYIRFVERQNVFSYLRLKVHAGRGIAWGLMVSAVISGPIIFYRVHLMGGHFHLPLDIATWMNPILTAPIAEEIVFRGVIFRKMEEAVGSLRALVASALLFALIHFPYWYLSGDKAGKVLVIAEGTMFVYGLVFAGLVWMTRSLWAPMTYHVLNNLVSISLGV
jgi:membrane protease YdiL (CAAX protease family)